MSAPPDSEAPIFTVPTPAQVQERDGLLQILRGWHEGLAPLSPSQKRALVGTVSDVDAIARGTLTSAHDVLSETANGLVRVKAVALVSAHSRPLRYAKYRMRYLLDLLFELREAVDDQTMRTNAWVLAQDRLAREIDGARTVRMGMLNGLARVVRLHDDVAQEVANARGQADHAPAIAASLEALAGLIEAWEADADKLVLLESVGLEGMAVEARAVAASLEAARRAVNEFSATRRDRASTNLIEGRLMTELQEFYRALEEGQGVIAGLPRLPLGDTLRRAFGRITGTPIAEESAPAKPVVDKPAADPAEPPAA